MNPAPPNPSGYMGNVATIALGRAGLFTDAAQSDIPTAGLIRANNVTYYNQIAEKDYGSRIWNSSPLPASIVRAQEMFTDAQSTNQRIYALCADGNLYKFTNYFTQAVVSPSGGAPATLNPNNHTCMVVGGNELLNFPKKLFTFDGYDPVQVISGDASVRTTISLPAADWTGTNQPFGGVMHRGSLYAWGNINNPHQIYASSVINHEDFQTVGQFNTYSVYPGEFDGIVCGCVFRGRLYVFKYPRGIYYLVDTDADRSKWYFAKQSDDFGACSPQSATVALNDLMISNNYGSVSSLLASLVFGDTLASDLFHTQQCFRFAEDEVRPDIVIGRSMVYYAKKQQLIATFQSNDGNHLNRMVVIDFKNPQKIPRISWTNKDQPNCLFLVRDRFRIPKPFYGSSDGNLYEMDIADRWVGSGTDATNQTAYLFDIQTPHMDFSQDNVALGSQVKTFEWLEVEYEPTGNWNVSVDVYIDARLQGTKLIDLSGRSSLDELPLDSTLIDGGAGFRRRIQIQGQGRTISLRFYNNGLGQNVKLIKALVYYRLSGQQQLG